MPENLQTQDKAQIGLTPVASQKLDRIMETGWFAERQDAYRVAIGVALSRGLNVEEQDLSGIVTSYNFAGGIDRDHKLRTLISIFAPNEVDRPAVFSERLAHAGIDYLYEQLTDENIMLSEALEPLLDIAANNSPVSSESGS